MKKNPTITISREPNVAAILFTYWAVLVAWQKITHYSSKSTADVLLKIGLLMAQFLYFFILSRGKMRKLLHIYLFAVCLVPAFLTESGYSMNTLIYYFYLVLFVGMVYGLGGKLTISQNQYVGFLNAVIDFALFMALYAMIFRFDDIVYAIYSKAAYGSEISSFFSSSHEYALYLSAAMIGCFYCLELSDCKKAKRKRFYILSLCVLTPNLLLTYSRTAIYSTVIFFICFLVAGNNQKLKCGIFILACLFLPGLLVCSNLGSILNKLVFKGGNARKILFHIGIDYFIDGTIPQVIFGHGMTNVKDYLMTLTPFRNTHCAYLQMLLYYGLVGVSWIAGFLFVTMTKYVRLYRANRPWGNRMISLLAWCCALMVANTHMIFTSPIDCYFITMFAIVVPKYVCNGLQSSGPNDKIKMVVAKNVG